MCWLERSGFKCQPNDFLICFSRLYQDINQTSAGRWTSRMSFWNEKLWIRFQITDLELKIRLRINKIFISKPQYRYGYTTNLNRWLLKNFIGSFSSSERLPFSKDSFVTKNISLICMPNEFEFETRYHFPIQILRLFS